MLQITGKHAAEIDDWRRWQVKKKIDERMSHVTHVKK